MPAILRIFLYQTDASLCSIGSCLSYDQGGVGSGQHPLANKMPWRPYMYRPSHAHRKITMSQNITCRFICVYIWRRLVSVGKGCQAAVGSEFTNPYHISRSDGVITWWFWFGLPLLTMSPIWVEAGHVRPLPIITTATKTTHNRTRHR